MAVRGKQFVAYYGAWDTSANTWKTGDSANHSMSWVKDGTRSATTNAAAEVDATNTPGQYKVTITATEADCTSGMIAGKSSTANIQIVPTSYTFEYLPDAVPGASGGLLIAGSNAATTLASLTITGALTVSDGVIISASTASRAGLAITGAASGNAVTLTAGSSAYGLAMTGAHGISITTSTGAGLLISATSEAFNLSSSGAAAVSLAGNAAGLEITSAASDAVTMVGAAGFAGLSVRRMVLSGGTGNTTGLSITGNGTGAAVTITGGATGNGVTILGGATSGHGLSVAGQGTSSHGVLVTGGSAGTSDGMKFAAGTGGVGLRADSATVTGATTLTGAVALGSTLAVAGTTTLTGAVSLGSTLAVTGTTTLTGAVSLGSTLGITGNVTLSGTLGVGATTLASLTVTNNFSVGGTTTLTGAVTATNGSNAISGVSLTAAAYEAAADALLGRNVAGGSSTGRLVKEALYFLRNKWTVSAGTLTVYQTDDTTSSWTAVVAGTAGADPVTSTDPA